MNANGNLNVVDFYSENPTGLYYTSCGKNYSDFSTPGKFCKNCGKPIKITGDK